MKLRLLSPFIILAILVLFVGLACGISAPPTPTLPAAIPTRAVALPTNPPAVPQQGSAPTNPPVIQTSVPPTSAPAQEYFTETFQGDFSLWTRDISQGDSSKFSESQTSNGLHVQLDDTNLYVYYYYSPVTYQDVRIDLTYTNLAHNSNNINLICRKSSSGWYEFTVQNDGLWQIWAYDIITGQDYVMLADGGSTAILPGRQQNEITATCIGEKLTLYINGTLIKSLPYNQFFLSEGEVGFGVNISPNNQVTPVIVDFNSLTISKP
jgi:hypothetical protein